MFPDDADVAKVRRAMFDPFEYLMLRHKGRETAYGLQEFAGQSLLSGSLSFARTKHRPEDT